MKMVRVRPRVATLLHKTEHAIQIRGVLHGNCSEPNATQKVERHPWEKQSLSPKSINFTRRFTLKCQFCEVNLTHVFQNPFKLHGQICDAIRQIAHMSPAGTPVANQVVIGQYQVVIGQ